MKLHEFLSLYGNRETIVNELRHNGLLRTHMQCENCGDRMIECTVQKGDGLRFRCSKRSCRKEKSIRVGSFFEKAKLNLCDCMLFLHLWSKGYTEQLICDDFPFARGTTVDWSRFCRELCVYHYESSDAKIGGPGTIVEIDETLIVKRKYDRGRMLTEGWLFGGIERRSDGVFNCFMRVVYNRSAAQLTHLIQQHVELGTTIMTDGWAAYVNLGTMGYFHQVVIHADNFISPDDASVHTQTIESTWCSLKRFIRSRGTHKGGHMLEYICEWLF
jgi:IS1 family transposase